MKPTKLAIFASGSGTNAENIINYFKTHSEIQVEEVFSNKQDAFVHERARKLGVRSSYFKKAEFHKESFLERLNGVDYLILAGFLWLVPAHLIKAFPNKIINIHPSLLPKYGGQGMYGAHVHNAVIAAGEKVSGITIHLVNEAYDQGKVLFQGQCMVEENDTADMLASKIHQLEYEHFPRVIEAVIHRQ